MSYLQCDGNYTFLLSISLVDLPVEIRMRILCHMSEWFSVTSQTAKMSLRTLLFPTFIEQRHLWKPTNSRYEGFQQLPVSPKLPVHPYEKRALSFLRRVVVLLICTLDRMNLRRRI